MTEEQQLAFPLDTPADPQQPVRVLDAVEAESTECKTCGGRAEFRLYRNGKVVGDYDEQHLPLPYNSLPPKF